MAEISDKELAEMRRWLMEVRRHSIATTLAAERALDAISQIVVQSDSKPSFTIGPSETKSAASANVRPQR